jgi:hypothetical protein
MELNIISVIVIPLISLIFFLLAKGVFLLSTFGLLFFTLLSIYIYNNLDRKETLSIFKDNGVLYFYLSDDQLFTVKFSTDQSLSEVIRESIRMEMITIEMMVDQINFMNFRDDRLHRELNELVGRID